MTTGSGVVLAASVLVVIGVAAIALGLHPSQSRRAAGGAYSTQRALTSERQLVSRLAVLRRPQTALDRTLGASQARFFDSMPQRKRIVPSLTRLAASLKTAAGEARVYVIALRPTKRSSYPPADEYEAWAITVRAGGANATAGLTVQDLARPQQAPGPLPPAGVVASGNGVNQSLVPDGVVLVRWVFGGRSPDGERLRAPVTIYPTVHNNIALAPMVRQQGLLAAATWYSADGRVIASWRSRFR